MKKTTADVPPKVGSEYAKAKRPQAVAEAVGDGYTDTKRMRKARLETGKEQFGLPMSPGKKGLKLRVHISGDK